MLDEILHHLWDMKAFQTLGLPPPNCFDAFFGCITHFPNSNYFFFKWSWKPKQPFVDGWKWWFPIISYIKIWWNSSNLIANHFFQWMDFSGPRIEFSFPFQVMVWSAALPSWGGLQWVVRWLKAAIHGRKNETLQWLRVCQWFFSDLFWRKPIGHLNFLLNEEVSLWNRGLSGLRMFWHVLSAFFKHVSAVFDVQSGGISDM